MLAIRFTTFPISADDDFRPSTLWFAAVAALLESSASEPAAASVSRASSRVPSVRANQATPCSQPVSIPAGVPAPSSSTAADGVTAAKSSFSAPAAIGAVASTARTVRPPGRAAP